MFIGLAFRMRRFYLRHRELCLFLVVVLTASGGLGLFYWPNLQRARSATAVIKLGGRVSFRYVGGYYRRGTTPEDWMTRMLGDAFFDEVIRVKLDNTYVSDADLVHLKGFRELWEVSLNNTPIGDAGLQHLSGLRNLKILKLYKTKVTDDGVEELRKSLPKLLVFYTIYANQPPPTKLSPVVAPKPSPVPSPKPSPVLRFRPS